MDIYQFYLVIKTRQCHSEKLPILIGELTYKKTRWEIGLSVLIRVIFSQLHEIPCLHVKVICIREISKLFRIAT